MKIGQNSVVTIDYTLQDASGDLIESTQNRGPIQYLHGHGQIVPGLERALDGHEAGAAIDVSLPPAEAYGDHDPGNVQVVSKSQFPPNLVPEAGRVIQVQGPGGQPMPVQITKVEGDAVTLDGNHPLAGKTLKFQVEVKDVREASPNELSHGHAHEPGQHGEPGGEAADEGAMLESIKKTIAENDVALFMKGTPAQPMCGFSASVVQTLNELGAKFEGVNALQNPQFRHVLSSHSNWPTLPQLFVKGKLIGGADIVREMHASGDLKKVLDEALG